MSKLEDAVRNGEKLFWVKLVIHPTGVRLKRNLKLIGKVHSFNRLKIYASCCK